ncbi:hypothetical protein H0H92_011873 [Tricholoma furcatifolium]|nr:hypothetical protein H0H92_011873 [Tricholoma furcatifolium]
MVNSFEDLKVEGWLLGAAASSAKIRKYIQKQIEAHESKTIIRYYKNRRNAFTITCRIPPEVLACIFRHVVTNFLGSRVRRGSVHWIKMISHVCSHWREVALSSPSLWSTIDIDFSPALAQEMLLRSKKVLLSVKNTSPGSKDAYPVLQQTLASHFSRIQNLTVHLTKRGRYKGFLQLLGQCDFTKMERLEIHSIDLTTDVDNAQPQTVPDRIITQSVSLRYLILNGYGINWLLSPAFGQSLKAFSVTSISVAQTLRFLSHIPLLETLSITLADNHHEISPSHGAEQAHMKYLKDIKVSCESLSPVTSFFEHFTFPKENNVTVNIKFIIEALGEQLSMIVQTLIRKMDDVTDGSISKLVVDRLVVKGWKSRQKLSADWQLLEPPVIELAIDLVGYDPEFDDLPNDSHCYAQVTSAVLRASRLDCLTCLQVEYCDDWPLLGNLPHIQDLTVYSNEEDVITTLSRMDDKRSKGPHSAFPALTHLTIIDWNLGPSKWNKVLQKTIAERLLDCVKLRKRMQLPLKQLRLKRCKPINDSNLSRLKKFIGEVRVISNGEVSSDSETQEDFRSTSSDYRV